MHYRCLLFSLAVLTFSPSTAWADVKNTNPGVHEVEAIEGRAPHVEGAWLAARQTAVDKVVRESLLSTPEEQEKYLAVRVTLLAEASVYTGGLTMSDKYRDGSSIVVTVAGPVDKEKLRQRLLALGVIQDTLQATRSTELPRLALRAVGGRADYPTAVAITTVHHRLSEKRLAILDESRQRDLAAEDREMMGVKGTASQLSSADIELAIRADVSPTQAFGELQMYQAQVFIEAYIPGIPTPFAREVYKSRELAFKSAEDRKKSQAACVEEAIGGALSPLMTRMLRELQEEKEKGKTGALRVVAADAELNHIEKTLRGRFASLTAVTGTGQRLFVARWADQLDDVLELIANDPDTELIAEPERGIRNAVIHLRKRSKRKGDG